MLTNKQQTFINEYLLCWNATEAARRAGYSEKTAYSIGPENLKKPEIQQAIEARIQAHTMKADEALARLSDIARADMSDFVSPHSLEIDLVRAQDAGKLHLLKRVTRTITTKRGDVIRDTTTIELHDAQAALVQIINQQRLAEGKATSRVELMGEVVMKGYTNVSPDDWKSDGRS